MKKVKLALVGVLLSTLANATDYGLIIGCCEEYKSLMMWRQSLRGISKDVKVIKNILLDRGVANQNIIALTNRDATKKNIKNQLSRLEGLLKPNDRLYFYFSGHGARATSDSKEIFFKKEITDETTKRKLNRTAFIPYDFNPTNQYRSAIISYDDLRPVFHRLDNRRVKVVMFADACFAGTSYKRGNPSEISKRIQELKAKKSKKVVDNEAYQSLIFFGASLNDLQAREKETIYGKRGEFTIFLEKCLNEPTTDRNKDGEVSKNELQKCMIDDYPNYAEEAHIYPSDRLGYKSIIKAIHVRPNNNSNLIKVKYSGKDNLQGIAERVSSNYELELLLNGQEIDVYRLGSLYASIDKDKLVKYLKAYKLFSLKTDNPNVELSYRSESTDRREDTFCAGEIVRITDKNLGEKNMTVLTLDKKGRVIILKDTRNYAQTEVLEPYGIDRVKIFTYRNSSLYRKIVGYKNRNRGVLSNIDIKELYNLFVNEPTLQVQGFEIRTTSTPIEECLKGDR